MIKTIEEVNALLDQDENLMVCMEMNGACWVREGVRGKDGVLVADGRFVEQITPAVFDVITPQMGQEYCSEFFQKRAAAMV